MALALAPSLMHGMADQLPLEQFRWMNRPLVIFAASNGESALKEQDELLAKDHTGLDERDIKVIRVIGSRSKSSTERSRLGVGVQRFSVVLLGKDGLVKLRRYKPVSTPELFRLIDSMPMRKREMGH